MNDHLAFWEDLRRDLEDPDFAREYAEMTAMIRTLDRLAQDEQQPGDHDGQCR